MYQFLNDPNILPQSEDMPETIPARFGLIWFSFRGEDLNVIFYQIA
jgi:hypothetical protein